MTLYDSYYSYKNDSHLYVIKKPVVKLQTIGDLINDSLGQLYLREHKIKPIMVNCTVAPQAEDCILIRHKLMDSIQNNSSMAINRFFTIISKQHRQVVSISILLIFVLLLILIFILLIFIRRIRTHRSTSSTSLLNGTNESISFIFISQMKSFFVDVEFEDSLSRLQTV